MELVEVAGFDALDSGSLSDSWRQQPGTPAYCTELTTNELKSALRSADRSRAPGNRDALLREFLALQDAGINLAQSYLFGRPVPLADLDFETIVPSTRNVA